MKEFRQKQQEILAGPESRELLEEVDRALKESGKQALEASLRVDLRRVMRVSR